MHPLDLLTDTVRDGDSDVEGRRGDGGVAGVGRGVVHLSVDDGQGGLRHLDVGTLSLCRQVRAEEREAKVWNLR